MIMIMKKGIVLGLVFYFAIFLAEFELCANDTAMGQTSGKELNSLNGFRQFTWRMSKEEALQKARSLYKSVEKDFSGIRVYLKKMSDGRMIEWFELKFESGKLASVRHRINNPRRKPPFVEKIIRNISARYGPPKIKKWKGEIFFRKWEGKNTIIETQNRASEWYVDIYYQARELGKESLTKEKKLKIWNYYLPLEDRLGKDKAIEKTAKKFGVTEDDVFNIMVEGINEGWPD